MFAQERRIRTTRDIISVLRRGNRRSLGVVACSFLRKPATLSRVAVIVDNKVSKKAVVRNLLKRRVRAVLEQHSLPSGDIIIRLYKGADALSFEQLQEQVLQCLKRTI